jgi:BlaI family transcriptional regulator, penicillinase repressor
MARPRNENPTPAELELLRILWDLGPATGREVLSVLEERGRERAYTSVTSLLNVMFEKGYVTREPAGRALRYAAAVSPDETLADLVGDLRDRVFDGSASTLVAHLLQEAEPTREELAEIRRAIASFEREQGGRP